MSLHFLLRQCAQPSSAPLLKFARLSGETDPGRHSRHVLGQLCCSRSLYLWRVADALNTSSPTHCRSEEVPSCPFKLLFGNLSVPRKPVASLIMSEFDRAVGSVVTSAFSLSHLMLNQGGKTGMPSLNPESLTGCRRGEAKRL